MRMSSAAEKIRLIIADDHPMITNGLRHILSADLDVEIVAEANNGEELISLVKQHRPCLVITDLNMPRMDGPKACLKILQDDPETNILVYSMYDSEEMVRKMRGIGVKGYLLKSGNAGELSDAIRTVCNGGEYYCRSIRERSNRYFHSGAMGRGSGEPKQEFSETELQIIRLLCSDFSTKQIADKLKLKERTVQAQKEKIEDKMGVRSVVGIVTYAMSNWLLH